MPEEMTEATAGPQAAAPPMPAPPRQIPPGPTGQATMAPQMAGREQQGRVKAHLGLSMLEQAAADLGGSMSEDGREVLSVVLKLRKRFGSASPDLGRQEVKMLGEKVAPVTSPSPLQGQQMQNAIKQRQMSQGLAGAA